MIKKKSDLNDPATKSDLFKLENRLDSRIDSLENRMGSFESRMDTFDVKLTDFRNEMLTNFDKVFKEFKKIREDRVFAIAKDRKQDRQIENLDKRVKILESTRA
jgi:chaperonin cofactor prefoldin